MMVVIISDDNGISVTILFKVVHVFLFFGFRDESPSLRRVSIGTRYRVIFTGYQDDRDTGQYRLFTYFNTGYLRYSHSETFCSKVKASWRIIKTWQVIPFLFFTEIVKELGGQVTEDIRECTVLVADHIKRTAKVRKAYSSFHFLLCTVLFAIMPRFIFTFVVARAYAECFFHV
jgi:hypothetical protein